MTKCIFCIFQKLSREPLSNANKFILYNNKNPILCRMLQPQKDGGSEKKIQYKLMS